MTSGRRAILWLAIAYSVAHFAYSGIVVPLRTSSLRQIKSEMRPVAAHMAGAPVVIDNPRQYGPTFFFVTEPVLRFSGGDPDRLARAFYALELAVLTGALLRHVVNPLELLRDVARVLKPSGLLYVEVPNAGGLAARLFGCSWLAYDVPHHLYHFTPATLAATAARAGLQRTTESHFSLEYSPPTLLQTVLNAATGNNNLLFNRLAFSSRSQASGTAVAMHATAAAVIAFPALLASVGLAAAGVGDTYGAYFRHA